ncbi:MAG: hypothetical protein HQ515_22070 [Phycisphaeraceae bacterium]|nr:hypothetical protein [Phycisphaeraceae bacterium]
MKKHNLAWTLCIVGIVTLCVLSFTPLVIPAHESTPMFLGVPRTLWLGILVYVAMVVLTWIGTRVHPEADKDTGDPV